MTKIDHDAIAARVRQDRMSGTMLTGPVYIKLADMADAYLDLYDEAKRLRAERDRFEAALGRACQVGGTTYLVERAEKAEAERDRLRAALDEIATAASGIAHDIHIGPDDEGRDIYDMALAIRDDARAALKGSDHE